MELEERCGCCGGSGRGDFGKGAARGCEFCHGTGMLLTGAGIALFEFLSRFGARQEFVRRASTAEGK